jgi:hypothetical protein
MATTQQSVGAGWRRLCDSRASSLDCRGVLAALIRVDDRKHGRARWGRHSRARSPPWLAGTFGAYQLALFGTEVIKVESPGAGDLARQLGADPALNKTLMGASFLAQNAGKRSVTINLKSAAGKDVFRRLVRTADVVIENFRPGVMERLGLGYDALREVKPGLVYCAISGFGQDGPLRDNPAYDQIVQGMSGVMSVTGDAASPRLRGGYPVADTIGGRSLRHSPSRRRWCGAGCRRANASTSRCWRRRWCHGLAVSQLADRRRAAAAAGQPRT